MAEYCSKCAKGNTIMVNNPEMVKALRDVVEGYKKTTLSMLPDKALNIYPKSNENLEALINFYFNNYDINKGNSLQLLQEKSSLTLNQCEYIIKMLSDAYIPIFRKHLKGQITLMNLIQYGIDALTNEGTTVNGSENRKMITKEFRDFVLESNN